MADLYAECRSQPERDQQPGDDRNECEQIVGAANTGQALKELLPVQDADPVQEHDEADQADRSGNLRLGRNGTDSKTDEQHGADAK